MMTTAEDYRCSCRFVALYKIIINDRSVSEHVYKCDLIRNRY